MIRHFALVGLESRPTGLPVVSISEKRGSNRGPSLGLTLFETNRGSLDGQGNPLREGIQTAYMVGHSREIIESATLPALNWYVTRTPIASQATRLTTPIPNSLPPAP